MIWLLSLLGLTGAGIGGAVLLGFGPAILGFAMKIADAIGSWLSRRSLTEIACIGLGLVALVAILNGRAEKRHSAKVEARLTATTTLYHDAQNALVQTVANYRAAAEQARKADAANKVRVEAEQAQINKEQSDEYEARVTAARALADRLRHELAATANPGGTGKPPVSRIPAPAGQPPQTATDGLSDALTATEQAIQLDELIKWVRRQHDVDPTGTQPTQGAKP